jgi:hypothetical protein
VLVVVTVVNVLTVAVMLVELSALVEAELVVTELVTMLVSEVDEVLLVVEPRLVDVDVIVSLVEVVLVLDVDVEENVDALVVVVDDMLFVCVWAPTIHPDENDKRRARKVTVMRVHMLILLHKPATFALS